MPTLIDRVFVSFPNEHRSVAERVVEALKPHIEVWFDEDRLLAGDPTERACTDEADASRHLVAVIGEASRRSVCQKAELGQFDGRDLDHCRLIPVQMGKQLPYLFAATKAKAIRSTDPETIVKEVLEAFGFTAQTQTHGAISVTAWRDHVRGRFQNLVNWAGGPGALRLDRVVQQPGLANVEFHRRRRTPTRRRGGAKAPNSVACPPGDAAAETLEDLVEPGARVLVWGEPGSGKTTLFRHLAWKLAHDKGKGLPFFLRLAEPSERRGSPYAAAAAQLGLEDDALQAAGMRLRQLASGQGRFPVFLLDGLDEVPTGEEQAAFEFVSGVPDDAAVLISARKQLADTLPLGDFTQVVVRPLQPDQQEQLLNHLLADHDVDAAEFAGVLRGNPRLGVLAGSPLLLTLMAVLVREDPMGIAGLPQRRGALFADATKLLLRRGHGVVQRERGVAVRSVPGATKLLGELAFHLHATPGETWDEEEVEDAIVVLRSNPHTLFAAEEDRHWRRDDGSSAFDDDIRRNAGVFGPLDGDNAPWRFFHRTFREYLAANALRRGTAARRNAWFKQQREDIARRHEPPQTRRRPGQRAGDGRPPAQPSRWGEVHALLCGMVANPRPLLEPLLDAGPGVGARAILDADNLAAEDAAELLLQAYGLDWEQLDALVSGWELPDEERAAILLEAVGAETRTAALGMTWFLVERLTGTAPAPEAFFGRAGRWPESGAPEWPDCGAVIEPGEFVMGSTKEEQARFDRDWDDERPPHRVTLTERYRLTATPVTLSQWRAFAPEWHPPELPSACSEPEHPLNYVSWWEAYAYSRWLGGRLPTEAEWERACRGGEETAFWSGDSESDLAKVGWYSGNRPEDKLPLVSQKPANAFGLHDMHGLVFEWCEDGLRTYDESPQVDPLGPASPAADRVMRGGSFWSGAVVARAAYRGWSHPSGRDVGIGFRVRLPPQP